MFPNLTWPYDSEFPGSNWNFKFPVSMTRRRNHMFENTSCPCLHQHLTNIMLLSHFIFGLNSISIVSNSFIRNSQRGKIQRETKTRIKLNQSVYTFHQNVTQECLQKISLWVFIFEKRKVLDAGSNSPTEHTCKFVIENYKGYLIPRTSRLSVDCSGI